MKQYIVHHVKWYEFSKQDWKLILSATPLGECVATLPYETPTSCLKIPILAKASCFKTKDFPTGVPITMKYLEFSRIKLLEGVAWLRTH